MLIFLLLWSLLIPESLHHPQTQPSTKNYDGEFLILKKDTESGCKIIKFHPSSFYFYGDSCIEVPKNFNISGANYVSLRTTKIQRINKGELDNWSEIESLNLEVNTELKIIDKGSFSKLKNLLNLTISNNYNLELPNFDGLINLKELTFTNSNLKNLKQFLFNIRPSVLPNLKKLDISENYLENIKNDDFIYLNNSGLTSLYMTYCSLVFIDPKALNLKNLNLLSLDNNYLNTSTINNLMKEINETSKNFTSFSLCSNLLDKNPYSFLKTISFMNITDLNICENHFDPMTSGFFPEMPNLNILNLSGIKAVTFENGTLDENLVPNLKKLILSKNRFSGIMDGFLLPNLVELDISENTCATCFTTSLFKINDFQLEKMKELQILNLNKNNLYHLRKFKFNLKNLKELYLSNCTVYRIDDFTFSNLTNLEILDLSNNNLMNYIVSKNIFQGLNNLMKLNLENNGITTLSENIFENLENLLYLNVKNNALVEFGEEIFVPLVSIVTIDLSYNDILEWNFELFKKNLKLENLYLVSNQIRLITQEMIQDFSNLKFVDLSENTFACTCEAVAKVHDYVDKIGFSDLNLLHLNDSKNVCFSPREWGSTDFIDYLNYNLRTGYCDNYMIAVTLITVAGLIFVVFFIGVVYYLRWHIRYWTFLLRQTLGHNYFPKKKPNLDGKYKYDAFVSYSHEDRNFVVKLVAMLESQEPFLSLCVFERDFQVGGVITENVVECLRESRRTILVLSDSFAQSTWCLWEMQMAQHKWIFYKDEENNPLIIIKIGEIMERHMTPTLKYLIKTRIYLQWNSEAKKQRIFWQKLREALSTPTMN